MSVQLNNRKKEILSILVMGTFANKSLVFRKNQEGVTAIEFAIVAPVFFLLLMGIIEFALIYFTQSVLEGAGAYGARLGKTGYTEGDRASYIRDQIMRLSGGYLDPSRIDIRMLTYGQFSEVGQIEPCIPANIDPCNGNVPNVNFSDINGNGIRDDRGILGPGGQNKVVLYKITYDWPVVTPVLRSAIANAAGNYVIQTYSLVKNEGF